MHYWGGVGILVGLICGVVMAGDFAVVWKIVRLQALVVAVVVSGFFVAGTLLGAVSALAGGLIGLVPNCYFAYRIHSAPPQNAKQTVQLFYSSEWRKIIITGGLFALALQIPNVQFFPLMACFVSVLSVFWLALILFAKPVNLNL